MADVNSVSPIVVNSSCVRTKSKKASCRECVDSCTYQALLVTDSDEIAVDSERCRQCGHCVFVCPVQAIEGTLPSRKVVDNVLYADFDSPPTVKELLLYYCENCHQIVVSNETPAWLNAIERANHVLEQLNLPIFNTKFDPSITNEKISRGRRSFLRFDLMRQRLVKPSINNQPLNHCFDEYQFFDVALDQDNCTLCSACLRLCPNAAIKYEKQRFVIENGRCFGCKLCQEACPENALQVTENIQLKTVSAYPFIAHVCPDCRQNYLSVSENSALCVACRVKKALNLTGANMGMHGLNFSHNK